MDFDVGPHQGAFSGQVNFERLSQQADLLAGNLSADIIALSFDNAGGDMFSPDDLTLSFEVNLPEARLDIAVSNFQVVVVYLVPVLKYFTINWIYRLFYRTL